MARLRARVALAMCFGSRGARDSRCLHGSAATDAK